MTESLIAGVAVGAVTCVLMAGLYTLLVGGETAATWSNYLMRVRVVAQFAAIIVILAVAYFSRH